MLSGRPPGAACGSRQEGLRSPEALGGAPFPIRAEPESRQVGLIQRRHVRLPLVIADEACAAVVLAGLAQDVLDRGALLGA